MSIRYCSGEKPRVFEIVNDSTLAVFEDLVSLLKAEGDCVQVDTRIFTPEDFPHQTGLLVILS